MFYVHIRPTGDWKNQQTGLLSVFCHIYTVLAPSGTLIKIKQVLCAENSGWMFANRQQNTGTALLVLTVVM